MLTVLLAVGIATFFGSCAAVACVFVIQQARIRLKELEVRMASDRMMHEAQMREDEQMRRQIARELRQEMVSALDQHATAQVSESRALLKAAGEPGYGSLAPRSFRTLRGDIVTDQ